MRRSNRHCYVYIYIYIYIYGRKKWKETLNKRLHKLYSSPIVITLIRSRNMNEAERVARMGEVWNTYRILYGQPQGKNQSGNLGVDGSIILEWVLDKVGRCGLD